MFEDSVEVLSGVVADWHLNKSVLVRTEVTSTLRYLVLFSWVVFLVYSAGCYDVFAHYKLFISGKTPNKPPFLCCSRADKHFNFQRQSKLIYRVNFQAIPASVHGNLYTIFFQRAGNALASKDIYIWPRPLQI